MSTKSEKKRIERAFVLIHLYLLVKYEAITGFDHKKEELEGQINNILDESDPKKLLKINNRVAKLNEESGIRDLLTKGIDGHKYILLMYYLTLEIVKNNKTLLPQELGPIFNDFLEVESGEKDEQDRISIRKSAMKQAPKLFKKLQDLGYYN